MKTISLLFISVIIFFLSGCSYKGGVISVKPYTVNFLSFSKYAQSVYLNKFQDERIHKNIIAVVTDNKGNNLGYSTTQTNFSKWYDVAIKKALKANGVIVVKSPDKASLKISGKINNIIATFNKSDLTKENLTGFISLKLIIKKGNITITKTISEHINKYNGISVSNQDFKKEIKTLLDDSVRMIVKNILNVK